MQHSYYDANICLLREGLRHGGIERKSLAGINGIPWSRTNMPTPVFGAPRAHPSQEGQWQGAAPWRESLNVETSQQTRVRRELFGSFVVHYRAQVGGSEKDVWWEDGRWFSLAKGIRYKAEDRG